MRFADRLALITGAASGIGLAVARQLARDGARLCLVDRSPALADVADEMGASIAACRVGDVGDEMLWKDLESDLNHLSLAVVNAGISDAGRIVDLTFADWRRLLATNLDGAFLTVQAAMRAMDEQGGSIVVSASAAGLKAEPGVGAYGASKAALLHLMKVAAKEGAETGIRVNAIAPGGVETPIWRGMRFFEDLVEQEGSEAAAFSKMASLATPLGRYAKADEIARQILFLLSDDAATMTGATLVSDGGYIL